MSESWPGQPPGFRPPPEQDITRAPTTAQPSVDQTHAEDPGSKPNAQTVPHPPSATDVPYVSVIAEEGYSVAGTPLSAYSASASVQGSAVIQPDAGVNDSVQADLITHSPGTGGLQGIPPHTDLDVQTGGPPGQAPPISRAPLDSDNTDNTPVVDQREGGET